VVFLITVTTQKWQKIDEVKV